MGDQLRVSVVVPVYNAGPALRSCLASALDQDLPPEHYEVIAVDDGSTDGSAALLDAYAQRYPERVQVIHQDNSGWPGRPRNVGIEASGGRYLFFLDADDELASQALRRLADFADEHRSDVIIPKTVGLGGRAVPGPLFERTEVDADRVLAFSMVTPHRLIRRSFLDEQGLRFPEGKVYLEDGILLARAYLCAGRLSVLADYDYYRWRLRSAGGNISMAGKDPGEFTASVRRILDIARDLAADEGTADAIVTQFYTRKLLKYLVPDRFARYREARQADWVHHIGTLTRSHIPTGLEGRLPLEARLLTAAVRTGQVATVLAVSEALGGRGVPACRSADRVHVTLPGPAPTRTLDATADLQLSARVEGLRHPRGALLVRGTLACPLLDLGEVTPVALLRHDRSGREVPVRMRLGGGRLDALGAPVTIRIGSALMRSLPRGTYTVLVGVPAANDGLLASTPLMVPESLESTVPALPVRLRVLAPRIGARGQLCLRVRRGRLGEVLTRRRTRRLSRRLVRRLLPSRRSARRAT